MVTVMVRDVVGDGVDVVLGVTLGVGDGLAITYSVFCDVPMYNAPLLAMASDDVNGNPVLLLHNTLPVVPFNPKMLPSLFAMYTLPSNPIAGDDT